MSSVEASDGVGYLGTMSSRDATDRESLLADAIGRLRSSELRITAARREIIAVLVKEHGPFTTEEIHRRLERSRCDLVTVYRCLATMEEVGVVRRCDFGDGVLRYEFDNGGSHHHHHLVCRICGKVETIDHCVAEGFEEFGRERGYTNISHSLELFGICPECGNHK